MKCNAYLLLHTTNQLHQANTTMPEHIIDDWNCYFYEFESTNKLVRTNAYSVILYALVCTHCSQHSGMQLSNNVYVYIAHT